MARYAVTVGGRNLELVWVCLSRVWAGLPGSVVANSPSYSSSKRVLRERY